MARLRNRILKADFWSDGELLRWPREKRMTYVGLYSLAEDSGCMEDDCFTWKILLWGSPLDADVTVEKLELWRDELIEVGKLIPYTSERQNCLYIKSFHEHEHPRNPQTPSVPLPPWVVWVPTPTPKSPHRGHYDVNEIGQSNGSRNSSRSRLAKGTTKALAKRAKPADDGSFEMFWTFYPRREDRKKAETAWKYVSKGDRELAVGVAQVMGELFRNGQKAKEYIPLPTTFIRGARWEDWREGVPAGWVDSSEERAAQQSASIDAAIAAALNQDEA